MLRRLAALAATLTLIASPASAHSRAELDRWQEEWSTRAEPALSIALAAERADMIARHPCQIVACPVVVAAASQKGDAPVLLPVDIEVWRSLVARYFPADAVDGALSVLWCESRGNPVAQNPFSSAAGLFQFLAGTWAKTPQGQAGASVLDPVANVAAAAWLSDGGSDWSQWSCRP